MLDPLITEGVCGKSGQNGGVQGVWVQGGFGGRLGEGPAIDSGLLFRINRRFLTRMRPLCVLMK